MQKLKHIEFANLILSNINVNIVETYSCFYTGNRMSHFSRVLMFEPFMLHWGEHPCILLSKCRIFVFVLIVPEPLSGGILLGLNFEVSYTVLCLIAFMLRDAVQLCFGRMFLAFPARDGSKKNMTSKNMFSNWGSEMNRLAESVQPNCFQCG